VSLIVWYVVLFVLVGGAFVLSVVGIRAVLGAVVVRRRRGSETAERSRSVAVDE
jgi:hypothetical protein